MSSSAINAQLFQAKIGSIQNQADSTSVYSNGVWSFKNSTALTSVTITDAGNVGVGTTSPSSFNAAGTGIATALGTGAGASTLALYSTATTSGYLYFSRSSTGADRYRGYLEYAQSDDSLRIGTVGTERMRIDASGNLLVGYTSGGSAVTNGVVKAKAYNCKPGETGALGLNVFNINWTGSPQLWIDGVNVGTFTLTSDYRIKKNIETQELPALERIAQLRPVKYEYADYKELFKADGIQREGFIAHELQAVIPSAVEGEKDAEDQIQALKLDALCSVMVKAIQEQQAQIEALKAEVAALKAP